MGVGYGYTEGKIPTHSLFGMDWRFLDGLKAWFGNRKSNRLRTTALVKLSTLEFGR